MHEPLRYRKDDFEEKLERVDYQSVQYLDKKLIIGLTVRELLQPSSV